VPVTQAILPTTRRVLASRRAQIVFGVVNVIAQAGIAVTGSVVRVTESGLGCPTWPTCTSSSLVPVANPVNGQVHQWIEFSNRMLGGTVGVISALVFLSAVLAKPRRRRQVWLAAAMPLGVVVQAVMGGITVKTGLSWWTVSVHLLLSEGLVWLAVLLLRAAGEGDEPARPLIPRPLRMLQVAMAGVLAALLVAGTLVTAAGPHAGDKKTPRLGFPVAELAQAHADVLFVFLGMLVAFGFALRITGGDRALWRRFWLLVAVVVAQGGLGEAQYHLGVPDVLVILHVLGSTAVVAASAALWCAARDRGVVSTVDSAPDAAAVPAAAR
jgi:cytochrome c oxidase assembly protein subunit 15